MVHNSCDLPSSQIVRSDALKRIMKLVEQVASHPAAVLIVGETGTGKEMIAHAIHAHSLRCNKPLIDVNCAAIPEHLVESELFGYEKGAFSGADAQKIGFFEMADGGTLFLDEIGDLDPRVQVKLLRVLDGAPYYRLGGTKKVTVNARLVAATNQNLEELVRAGRFRNDLYHRLAEFKLEIPPLRERPEDLLGIAEQVLHQHNPDSRFSRDAVSALISYDWPGNVRELRNSIFRAVMLARNAHVEITADDLKLNKVTQPANGKAPLTHDLDKLEKQIVFDTLERCGSNQGKAAQALGISRRTLLRKLKVYRESESGVAVGTLGAEQQRYYRKQTSMPIRLRVGDETMEATLMNISLGGAAVSIHKILTQGSPVTICLTIPDIGTAAEIPGRVTWANSEGHHGIQFGKVPCEAHTDLQRWFQSEMKKDGWRDEIAG
ncbi:MAG TPA: sigma 54-interacting transcriptional regulator [Candidatus Sulfotelmatobacter sp.]|nr:sigma 54-interacting transcriptional regulator [Candidatus Sulfotelmatobacter sp.]